MILVHWVQKKCKSFLSILDANLNLRNNELTDEGVEHLSAALKDNNCKLNRLNLSCNKRRQRGRVVRALSLHAVAPCSNPVLTSGVFTLS